MTGNGTSGIPENRLAELLETPTASFEAQYRAASEAVAIFDRSHRVRIEVVGKDGESFLHNMLSAHIKNLGPRGGTAATFLTTKGKLVSDMTVHRDGERFVLELEALGAEPLKQGLSRYIISEDVTLSFLDEATFSLEGAASAALASTVTGCDASELENLPHLGFHQANSARVTAIRNASSARFDVAAPSDDAVSFAEKALAEGAVIGSPVLAELRRVEAGQPRFGVDMDDAHMPLEARLDDAIHFDKGCYIGQEYVVRLAHRGHLNRKLVGLRIEGDEPVAKDAPITSDGKEAGELKSVAFSPGFAAVLALAYIKRAFFEPGTVVTVAGRKATVTSLPFASVRQAR